MKMWIAGLALVASLATANAAEEKLAYLSKGVNDLGQKLLRQIEKQEKGKNVFISSFSIHEALSMAYAGAGGSTKTELAKLLGLSARASATRLAADWKEFREKIIDADPKVKIEIANSMWGNKDLKVRFQKEFTKLNRDAHNAELRDDLNFQTEEFLKEINGWASEKTHGKIPSVLSAPIPKDQLFYLVNAIYFKGVWTKEFDKKATRDGEFTKVDGKAVPAKLMVQSGRYPYYEDRQLQAVRLPFGKERRFGLTLFMPRSDSAKEFFSALRSEDLDRANAGLRSRKGTVHIPKFKLEWGNDKFVDILKSMGVKVAFSDDANFDGIAENESAKINKIIHKTFIEVNEEGAEAAAVTVVGGARTTSVEIDTPFNFEGDHPFYYEIQDNTTGVVLFSGVLHEPKA